MIKNRDKLEAVDFEQQCFKLDKIQCNLIKSSQNSNGSSSVNGCNGSTSPQSDFSPNNTAANLNNLTTAFTTSSLVVDSSTDSTQLVSTKNCRPFEQLVTDSVVQPNSPLNITSIGPNPNLNVSSLSVKQSQSNVEDQSQTSAMSAEDNQQRQQNQHQEIVQQQLSAFSHESVRPLVFCGPSGSGKSTLLKKLMREFENCFGFSISHTTRKPRNGEIHGKDYYFIEREEILKAIANGDFIEYAEFAGNIYGTSKKAVKDVHEQKKICLLDIDIEGVKNLKKTDLKPVYIFVKPPSIKVLEQRLRNRGSETNEKIQLRLLRAVEENAYGDIEGNFDILIVNDDFDEAYTRLRSFVENHYKINRKNIESLTKSPQNPAPNAK